jgi:hypothetical protein
MWNQIFTYLLYFGPSSALFIAYAVAIILLVRLRRNLGRVFLPAIVGCCILLAQALMEAVLSWIMVFQSVKLTDFPKLFLLIPMIRVLTNVVSLSFLAKAVLCPIQKTSS